jgi:transcriptional regulator with XRE-family HTH domain
MDHPFKHLRALLGDGPDKPLSQHEFGERLGIRTDADKPKSFQSQIAQIESGKITSYRAAVAAVEKFRPQLASLGFTLEDILRFKPKRRRKKRAA